MKDVAVKPSKAQAKSERGEPVDIDQTIAQIEGFYSSLTGTVVPPVGDGPYVGIPAEREPVEYVEQQLGRLLERVSAERLDVASEACWVPAASVQESPEQYLMCLDLPGVGRDTVTLHLEGRRLSVRGERCEEACGETRTRSREYPLGHFERILLLPADGVPEGITAEMQRGVLEIRLPRVRVSEACRTIHLAD